MPKRAFLDALPKRAELFASIGRVGTRLISIEGTPLDSRPSAARLVGCDVRLRNSRPLTQLVLTEPSGLAKFPYDVRTPP